LAQLTRCEGRHQTSAETFKSCVKAFLGNCPVTEPQLKSQDDV
jgi:hypothetical protein